MINITVLKFGAEWCNPCRLIDEFWTDIQADNLDVNFIKLDVDQEPEQASLNNVKGLPTIIIYKDGIEVDRLTASITQPGLQERIDDVKNTRN